MQCLLHVFILFHTKVAWERQMSRHQATAYTNNAHALRGKKYLHSVIKNGK